MPFRFGVIGAGGAAALHVPAMRTLPEIEVAAIADKRPGVTTKPCWSHTRRTSPTSWRQCGAAGRRRWTASRRRRSCA